MPSAICVSAMNYALLSPQRLRTRKVEEVECAKRSLSTINSQLEEALS